MLATTLRGGLGNQLFQLATALALARRTGTPTPIYLDLRELAADPLRSPAYAPYQLPVEPAPPALSARLWLAHPQPIPLHRQLADLLRGRHPRPILLKEPADLAFHPLPTRIPARPVLLDGYWQDARHFDDIAPDLRSLLRRPTLDLPSSRAFVDAIARSPLPVALHLRRGDYASDPATRDYHGLLEAPYYQAALDALAPHLPATPDLFLFTDDPAAAAHLAAALPYPSQIVHHPPSSPVDPTHDDLELMARCHHHITANSSFSWWAAYLCTHPAQHVISPKRWFRSPDAPPQHPAHPHWQKL